MNNSLVRLDLTQIFCDIDDFYQVLNRIGEGMPKLPYDGEAKSYNSKLSLSEVMYNRFVELMPWSLMGMIVFPQYLRGRDDRH
jgi:hypothetical protein